MRDDRSTEDSNGRGHRYGGRTGRRWLRQQLGWRRYERRRRECRHHWRRGKKTITVGVLTDITGPAASGNKTTVEGVKAGTYYASRQGYTVKYVVGDTATNPATVLSSAQKLVTQDHVSAVLAVSALTFAAAPYLTAHHVPVVGMAQDGPEWVTAKNMYSVAGPIHTGQALTTLTDGAGLTGRPPRGRA